MALDFLGVRMWLIMNMRLDMELEFVLSSSLILGHPTIMLLLKIIDENFLLQLVQ